MYRLIQVPLDGSPFAEQSLPLAISLAQRDGAALQVVRVHEPIEGVFLDRPGTLGSTLDRELMDKARENLDATVKSVVEETGLRVDVALLKGPVPEMISRHAAASEADLLVMTTQGRGPLGRMWFGSVADALVRQSPIPLLLVRPQEESSEVSQPLNLRRVLLPLDGSPFAEQALEPALALGGKQGEFTLLRVIPLISPVAYDPTSGRVSGIRTSVLQQLQKLKQEQEAEAKEYLEQLAQRLRARSVNVVTQLATYEQPATAILDAAAKRGVDAIAMTTRGRSGFKRLLLGSVADKVVRGATAPVLICPPVEDRRCRTKGVNHGTTTSGQEQNDTESRAQSPAILAGELPALCAAVGP
jgi:nucleotide-binding universal stress UspA family protein